MHPTRISWIVLAFLPSLGCGSPDKTEGGPSAGGQGTTAGGSGGVSGSATGALGGTPGTSGGGAGGGPSVGGATGATSGAGGNGGAGSSSGAAGSPATGGSGAASGAGGVGAGGLATGGAGGAPAGGAAGAGGAGGASGAGAGGVTTAPANGHARNPIVSHIFTADPSAKVFDGRVYVYGSHDPDDQMSYDMVDYHVFSSDDLVNWQDHGVVLDSADVSWAKFLYAPDCCHNAKTGKYHLFFPNEGSAIGVAVSDNPGGPFVDALGKPLIDKNTPGVSDVDWIFDPTCFIDDDGQAYLYFGGGLDGTGDNARVIRLKDDLVSLADTSATTIPAPDFFEASFMHKRGGKYYYSYSTSFKDHAAYIDYMMSDDPMTGFTYAGTILPSPDDNNGDNNHHSVVEFGGTPYLFYHNRVLSKREGLSSYQRSITLDHLSYDAQGKIVQVSATRGEVRQLKSVNARARVEAESIADQRGIETDFVQEGGNRIGVAVTELENQDWIGYSQLDFGTGALLFHARVASGASATGNIEIRLDGCDAFTDEPGTLIGTCEVEPTGGWQSWEDAECAITSTSGVHDLCLRFTGGAGELLNLDAFYFE